ncbi:hypothetical protein [Cohnella panacarvi]|uniref:hypothetical protein n=1 Tax=Cohnella panacarvi TaxID=400776 RepID=UPI00047D2710|nr:hypothetical protein [Cohnella panacarvi]
MEMQSLHAAFNSQEEAESAIRKLSALRGDQFRLEKIPSAESDEIFTDSAQPAFSVEASGTLGEIASPKALYSLSVNVPGSATEQARSVIRDAGGILS